MKKDNPFKYFRTNREIIRLAVLMHVRFSSQSDLAFEGRHCMHVSDWMWKALLTGALQVAKEPDDARNVPICSILGGGSLTDRNQRHHLVGARVCNKVVLSLQRSVVIGLTAAGRGSSDAWFGAAVQSINGIGGNVGSLSWWSNSSTADATASSTACRNS
jgi:hypothetical protein